MARTSAIALLSIALVLLQTGCERERGVREAPRSRSPVLVTIVVDQLAAWIAAERWPELPSDGGFARLVREGTWVRDVRFAHAGTDTAAGHAALYSGATPRASGIFANEILDARGTPVSILLDRDTHVIVHEGLTDQAGASARALRTETLADKVRAARPDATIVGLSLKDRGAIFGCGRSPDACLWYDRLRGTFVTSTAFAQTWPHWLPEVAAHPLAGEPRPWKLLDDGFVRKHAATPDAQPGEGDFAGLGITFPHRLPAPRDVPNAFRVAPRGDEVLLELALASIDWHRGSRGARDALLVALSLSTFDYVGHVFGPDSWESWDELARLDAALARFFAGLDERLGADGWAAMLSADHGVATMPEAVGAPEVVAECAARTHAAPARSCAAGRRIRTADLTREVEQAARAALGEGRWILGTADPFVFFTPQARALDSGRRAALDRAVVAALLANPAVESAIATAALPRDCPPAAPATENLESLICEAFPRGGAGDVYVALRPGAFVDPELVEGRGTSHGSPHLYDRAVPLVVRAPGRVAPGVVIDEPTDFRVFARTAATLLGVDPPDHAKSARDLGRILTERGAARQGTSLGRRAHRARLSVERRDD